ncbi:hypothetical protein AB0F91_10975 [Amycolatopsis sp. NPDC023774]|uniref:hypothetical protein n=1 Tax=Amycolatopsis sp. NPDC023774 TaxID=3155015 RepID=UPI00340FB507
MLLTKLGERIGRHPRFLGFELSNEPYYHWDSSAGLAVTPQQADAWAMSLCEKAETVAPGKAHTVGCDRAPWGNGRHNVVAIHPWKSFFGTLTTDPLSALATHNAERLIQVART